MSVRCVARVFFPLDEELQLLPGRGSPYLHEALIRLGTWLPFGRVPAELAFFCRTTISAETARRVTEEAGAVLEATQTAAVERLERELPEPPPGPAIQQLSVDGAMVPLVRGEWTEVKTLALGTVGRRVTREGKEVVQTTDLTYFSRSLEAAAFGRLATIATHAGGTARAEVVCAVGDGAEWIQGFIDLHRPDAVRILDLPHVLEHLATVAHAVYGATSPVATTWLDAQTTELLERGPTTVLAAVLALATEPTASAETQEICQRVHAYLSKRQEHLAYPTFRTAGYPIGDGAVESANKLVVQARLKGSGMHWERHNVNPMLSLRTSVCSDQWQSDWLLIAGGLRQQETAQRKARRQARHALPDPAGPVPLPPALPSAPPTTPPRDKLVVDGRPTADHPWRTFRLSGPRTFQPAAKP